MVSTGLFGPTGCGADICRRNKDKLAGSPKSLGMPVYISLDVDFCNIIYKNTDLLSHLGPKPRQPRDGRERFLRGTVLRGDPG